MTAVLSLGKVSRSQPCQDLGESAQEERPSAATKLDQANRVSVTAQQKTDGEGKGGDGGRQPRDCSHRAKVKRNQQRLAVWNAPGPTLCQACRVRGSRRSWTHRDTGSHTRTVAPAQEHSHCQPKAWPGGSYRNRCPNLDFLLPSLPLTNRAKSTRRRRYEGQVTKAIKITSPGTEQGDQGGAEK